MQFPDSFGSLLGQPILIVLVTLILLIVVLYFARRRFLEPTEPSEIRKIKDMHSDIKKGKEPKAPVAKSRQEIITDIFESKMNKIGLEPSSEAGYIPVSTGDFSDYMIQHGVDIDTMRAILDDLPTLKRPEVFDVVEAATEMQGVDFNVREVEEAKQLALNEWQRHRRQ
ncbi:MAG: hypothetical protein ACOC38_02185 [Promethearchaeia archaeon]